MKGITKICPPNGAHKRKNRGERIAGLIDQGLSEINELYGDSQYFFCDIRAKEVRFERCVGRQKANDEKNHGAPDPFQVCTGCALGVRNRLLVEAWQEGHPRRGKGQRDSECRNYAACLDTVVNRGWRTWNCESCDYFTIGIGKTMSSDEEPKNTRVCEDCKNKPTISASSPYCASCMAKRANEAKKKKKVKKKKSLESPKREGASKAKAEKSPSRGDEAVITIDFGKYASILKQVRSLAEEEVRPVESQVIYMLKTSLSETGENLQSSHE